MKVLSENLHILRSTYAEYEMKGLNEAHGAVLKKKKKKRTTKGVGKFTVCLGDGEIEKVHIWMIRKMASILSI